MGRKDLGLAARPMVSGGDISSVTALLNELLDHPQRHPIAVRIR
jgi:hypothetical protein